MKLTTSVPRGLAKTRSLLDSLVAMPDLAPALRSLPPHAFAALVRRVGVEDAGELVALATTPQLVQAFDEDLFVAERAGDREALDSRRFAVWLEVLLEAGDAVAARRVAELDEDFVAHALAGMLLVLDEDALRQTLDDADEDEARQIFAFLEQMDELEELQEAEQRTAAAEVKAAEAKAVDSPEPPGDEGQPA